jgi:hypothetical protein
MTRTQTTAPGTVPGTRMPSAKFSFRPPPDRTDMAGRRWNG